MLTYNALLYTERMNLGLTRRKMAKLLKMPWFYYSMCEKGYFKPTKKQAERISMALEVNYHEYLVGEPSYPSELPEKKKNKVVAFFYKVLGHLIFKIFFAVLAGASVGFMISGFVVQNKTESEIRTYFSNEYLNFYDTLKQNGLTHISATTDLMSPEYRTYEKDDENKTSKYISIVGSYNDKNIGSLTYTATYRTETSRLVYRIISSNKTSVVISAKYTEYFSSIVYSALISNEEVSYISYVGKDGNKDYYYPFSPEFEAPRGLLLSKIKDYENDFNQLLSEKAPDFAGENPHKLFHLMELENDGSAKMLPSLVYGFLGRYLGIILSGINLFILAYAFLYGTTKKGEKVYVKEKLDVAVDEVHRMKSDIRFAPFIPETILEIIGIFMVFIGSLRLVFLVTAYLTGNSAEAMGTSTGTELMQVFMVGMFLLYYVDFDIFLDDKRVIRNIVLYSIVYFCLYGLENLLYRVMSDDSIVGQMLSNVTMPNMFGSIACYYLIMLFLFYTPKFIKKRWQFITYRSMAALPIIVIFLSWYLFNGYNVLFTADWPIEVLNLFKGEKIPFSILAVSYLLGLYAMRSFFVIKYGRDRAMTFFNGNKFIWCKNIMITLIIIIIGIVELSLRNNPIANKLGLGLYWNILFLIPLLLFYHPHKGPRNIVLDWTTLLLYGIAISFSYISVILIVFVRLAG